MARSKFTTFILTLLLVPSVAFGQAVTTGVLGKPAPVNGTQIAGRDAANNLQPFKVDSAGNVSVATVGSRVLTPILGTVANTAVTYSAAGLSIGGPIPIATGLPAGTVLNSTTLRFRVRNADQAAGMPNSLAVFFNTCPVSSTLADNTAFSMALADMPKFVLAATASWASSGPAATGVQSATAVGPRLVVDGSGNVCAALLAGGSHTDGAANAITFEFEATF